VLSRELYEESLVWIEPYINVPRDQMTPFTDAIWDQSPVGEPKKQTQAVYALLDSVVQTVLTDENADIDALLAQAQTDAQALLDQ
jgi:multiple sugar transport system substrate-binding protein